MPIKTISIVILFVSACLGGCATDSSSARPAMRQIDAAQLPQRILLLPPDVSVHELSAGGVLEKVPEWSATARSHTERTLHRLAAPGRTLSLIDTPALDSAEQEILEEHLALYRQIASDAFFIPRSGEAWAHKQADFDYSLGSGLAFLREKTHADMAIIVIGQDVISTSERKVMAFIGALAGVAIPMGFTFMTVGTVDLQTGNLLWVNYDFSGTGDLREASSVQRALQTLFGAFPSHALALQP